MPFAIIGADQFNRTSTKDLYRTIPYLNIEIYRFKGQEIRPIVIDIYRYYIIEDLSIFDVRFSKGKSYRKVILANTSIGIVVDSIKPVIFNIGSPDLIAFYQQYYLL